ncbi:MAG: serine hydrolase [Clostridiales bacterium]|jgi:D-alanyl-D-alanine carboxypeptidase|nr:serine hydrolase [Clostridiales bacterium]
MKKFFRLLAVALCAIMVYNGVNADLVNAQPSGILVGDSQNVPGTGAAIVIDFATGEVLWERNSNVRRGLASMSKAFTAFIVYEEIAAGRLSLDTMITISQNAANASRSTTLQGNQNIHLTAGAQHSVDTLLQVIMLPSSNGACIAVAEHIAGSVANFTQMMNRVAQDLGGWAEFVDPHGGNPRGAAANRTTAYTVGRLVYTFIYRHPDILRITGQNAVSFQGEVGTDRNNTNLLIRPDQQWFFEGADGFRTGTTQEAGFCLSASAYRDGHRVITVVMGNSNNDGRYGDTHRLLNWGLNEAVARAEARRIHVQLNGNALEFDVAPVMVNDRVLVPMRAIFEALGAEIDWNEQNQTITATLYNGNIVSLTIENYLAAVNGEYFHLDVSPQIINDRTLVPIRFVAEATGASADWNPDMRTVIIVQ